MHLFSFTVNHAPLVVEIGQFAQIFQKLDREKVGLVPVDYLLKHIECKRSVYTDALLHLFDIDVGPEAELNFNDFFQMVISYCFFETPEILKCKGFSCIANPTFDVTNNLSQSVYLYSTKTNPDFLRPKT